MATPNKYFSKHFFRNIFIFLLVLFAVCFFAYKNETFLQASIAQCFIEELPDDYLEISDWYIEDGKPESAIKVLRRACTKDPENRGEYLAEIGDIYINDIGDLDEGIKILEEACKINPEENWFYYFSLSNAYLQNGRKEDAINILRKAAEIDTDENEIDPEEKYIQLILGLVENKPEIFDNDKFHIEPFDCCSYLILGNAYRELGSNEEAIFCYNKAIRLIIVFYNDPSCVADLYITVGIIHKRMERYEEAIECLNNSIKFNPNNADSYCLLGDCCYEIDRYEEAIQAYTKAAEINPNDNYIYNNLGIAYGELGRHKEEIDAYKKSIELNPDDPITHYNLGKTYIEIGNKESAMQQYEILKTLDEELAAELLEFTNP